MLLGLAVDAWNMMNGTIDWAGLEIVVDLVGVEDIESLIAHLQLIHAHLSENKS